jgi:dipeptidyl aminopeptidase/acylaminoacyl peptidase
MRTLSRSIVPLAFALLACGGDAVAPPAAPAPAPPATAATVPKATAASATPQQAAGGGVEPTALTEAQRQRDAAMAPRAAVIVDAYPNWNGFFSSLVASFSPDGKRVLFGSPRDGIPEIYLGEVDRPAEPPKAITAGPERAIWASFTRDGKAILFLRDTRGDEFHAIWRVNADGTGLTNLTPGEKLHRDEPLLPRDKPQAMLYSASRTTDTTRTLFAQDIGGGEAKVVYSQPKPGGAVAVSPDGGRVLFTEYSSRSDVVTREVEVATGKAHRVYPPEGTKAGINGLAYSADGARVLVSTDEGGESSALLALDPATGKELARYVNEAPKGAPMGLAPSPKGDRIAVRVDAGNHGEVRILDARSLKPERAVKVPLGDVQLGSFRDDGRAFSVLVSLPNQPADLFSVDAATGTLRPLRADKRAGLDTLPPIEATIESVKAFDGLTIPVNRYLPKIEGAKRLPTIVNFHGGPAMSYAVRWNPYARFFVSLGYAVLEPNVRGSTGFGRAYEMADNRERRADWLKDLEAVNAWTKAQPFCDPDRVVVWGQSYGGYTTLMALTRQPRLWRAGVDLYGVADLKAFLRTTDAAIRAVFVTEFGDLEKDGALLDEFSPMRDVDKIASPLFVYAGQNDPRVPRSESDTIVRALRARGVPVEYMVAANEGHTVDRRETKIELLTRTARFLEDQLKAKP